MSWSRIEDLHVQITTSLHPHLVNEVPQQQTQIVQIMPVSMRMLNTPLKLLCLAKPGPPCFETSNDKYVMPIRRAPRTCTSTAVVHVEASLHVVCEPHIHGISP